MTYKYFRDPQLLGNREFSVENYELIQEGLVALKRQIDSWNTAVRNLGSEPPYINESADLETMIDFGSQELSRNSRNSSWGITINGISLGSTRYLRAGMELILIRKRSEIRKKLKDGWPTAAVESLNKSLKKLEAITSKLNVEPADILWEVISPQDSNTISAQLHKKASKTLWDVFISHASEDKNEFVDQLAEALKNKGVSVWYDSFSLKIGDSLRRTIDKGLSQSRYGIVVLSPSFFAKEWPQKELDGLTARESDGQKVILPVWHKVNREAVIKFSPLLADRVATESRKGLDLVVHDLLIAISG